MRIAEVPLPEPAADQVRIRVAAAGIDFIDCYRRAGNYPVPLPFTPGGEVAGLVEAVGSKVSNLEVGDLVATFDALGGYAEYTLAPADRCVPVPDEVAPHDAAAVLLQGMTAHYLLHDTFRLQRDDVCLIHAAAGGVGLLLCQMAKTNRRAHDRHRVDRREGRARARRRRRRDRLLHAREPGRAG